VVEKHRIIFGVMFFLYIELLQKNPQNRVLYKRGGICTMKFSGKIVALLMVVSLLVGAVGAYTTTILLQDNKKQVAQVKSESTSSNADFKKIESIYAFINKNYFKKVDKEKLTNGAIQGMIESLDDPFSAYMDPKTANEFTQSLSSSFQGIGAEVQMVNGFVTIVSPIKGSPADKAGLRPHDQILKVNGKSLDGKSLYEAVSIIKGKKGTVAHLTVQRPGAANLLEFDITRDEIPMTTVNSKVYNKDGKTLGYIQITSFSENTDKEFKDALAKLEAKHIDGLMIDVRGNPGGFLDKVENIMSSIISSKKPVVQVEERDGSRHPFYSELKSKKPYPIVGLIDGGSASAAEILSGALKEAGGYPLVGVKSFGKGTVQQAITLKDNSELKLTMAKWLTPDGNWIHKKGLQPTVKVEEPDYFFTAPLVVEKGKSLSFDMNSDQIANAQKMLEGAGFDPGRTDGYFDQDTVTAVKAFQKASGLDVTGKIDGKTASKLEYKFYDVVKDPKYDLQLKTAMQVLIKNINK
jgi:carboxyl-terminal processing protease